MCFHFEQDFELMTEFIFLFVKTLQTHAGTHIILFSSPNTGILSNTDEEDHPPLTLIKNTWLDRFTL